MRKSLKILSLVLKDELYDICGNLEFVLEKIKDGHTCNLGDEYSEGDIACLLADIQDVYKKIADA